MMGKYMANSFCHPCLPTQWKAVKTNFGQIIVPPHCEKGSWTCHGKAWGSAFTPPTILFISSLDRWLSELPGAWVEGLAEVKLAMIKATLSLGHILEVSALNGEKLLGICCFYSETYQKNP